MRSARWLVVAFGGGAVVVGLLVLSGALNWFGHLPGDIRTGGEQGSLFLPFTSMLLIFVVASLIYTLGRRWLH
jgi:hypothetical protein